MIISDNVGLREQFLELLKAENSKRKEGIFITDLIYCLRQSFFRKACPEDLTERDLTFFVDGERRHEALQSLKLGSKEVKARKYGVHGRIDIVGEDCLIELKTTRSQRMVKGELNLTHHYVLQLGFYAAITGISKCVLVVQHVVPLKYDTILWEFIELNFTPQDMDWLDKELKHRSDLMKQASKTGSAKSLPMAYENWKCLHCNFAKKECKENL